MEKQLQQFKIGSLPMPFNVALLDEGKGITPTLVDNQAKWHKNCRNSFSELKLDREIFKSQKTEKQPHLHKCCTSTNI